MNELNSFEIPSFSSGFDSIGDPTSGPTGAPPPPQPEDPNAPGGAAEATVDPPEIVVNRAAYDQALAQHEQQEREIIADHLACEIARQTYQPYTEQNGWGGWAGWNGSYTRPTQAQCDAIINQLGGPEPDINDYITEIPATSASVQSTGSGARSSSATPDGNGSQSRGNANTTTLEQIWGTMGRP